MVKRSRSVSASTRILWKVHSLSEHRNPLEFFHREFNASTSETEQESDKFLLTFINCLIVSPSIQISFMINIGYLHRRRRFWEMNFHKNSMKLFHVSSRCKNLANKSKSNWFEWICWVEKSTITHFCRYIMNSRCLFNLKYGYFMDIMNSYILHTIQCSTKHTQLSWIITARMKHFCFPRNYRRFSYENLFCKQIFSSSRQAISHSFHPVHKIVKRRRQSRKLEKSIVSIARVYEWSRKA